MQFYRYVLNDVSDLYPEIKIDLQTFSLNKETPKGYWIVQEDHYSNHWISKTSKKRFAYPTKEAAWNNFVRRVEKRIKIARHQVEICELALKEIKETVI